MEKIAESEYLCHGTKEMSFQNLLLLMLCCCMAPKSPGSTAKVLTIFNLVCI